MSASFGSPSSPRRAAADPGVRYRRIVVEQFGGPDELRLTESISSAPHGGRALVRVLAAGVGATDVTARRGEYLLQRRRPFTPGYDLVGQVVHLPADAAFTGSYPGLQIGARVAACLPRMGTYTEFIHLPPWALVPVPETLDTVTAAAVPLDYLTADSLLHRHARLQRADTVVIHGATGGVGDALCQLGARAGLVMFGTASRRSIHRLARYPITAVDYQTQDLETVIRRTHPDGVDAVLDHLGGPTLRDNYRLLTRHGVLVSYAFAGRPGHILIDTVRGAVTNRLLGVRPARRTAICSLPWQLRTRRTWYRETLAQLLAAAARGDIRPGIAGTYPLAQAGRAHHELQEGTRHGKIILTV